MLKLDTIKKRQEWKKERQKPSMKLENLQHVVLEETKVQYTVNDPAKLVYI